MIYMLWNITHETKKIWVKKIWVKKNCWSQNIKVKQSVQKNFGPKTFYQQSILVHKIVGQKKILIQKDFGQK